MILIDNCFDRFTANEIEKIFLDKSTYWWYDPCTLGHKTVNETEKFYETFQLVHPIMENNREDSVHSSIIVNAIEKVFSNLKIKIMNYRRIKINLLTKNNFLAKSHPPHVDDAAENIISMIYYINDSDGDTFFYNSDMECVNKITPKKNRCVVFSSNKLHASSSPVKNDMRLVINVVASTNESVRDKLC